MNVVPSPSEPDTVPSEPDTVDQALAEFSAAWHELIRVAVIEPLTPAVVRLSHLLRRLHV